MAKIIHEGNVYQEVSLTMFHEREVQDQLASRANLVFPGYIYAEFMPLVTTGTDSAKPDFILVENEYRSWVVGEVEMVRHDLTNHVLRQVQVFLNGEYGEKHVHYALHQCSSLNEKRLRLLIESISPSVLVVADSPDVAWKTVINGQGAKMAVFEVFRRHNSADLIFRVNGDIPEVHGDFITTLKFDRSLRRLLRINTPSGLAAENGNKIEIEYNGMITEWVVMIAEDKAWLNPVGHPDMPDDATFMLGTTSEGYLRMEVAKNAAHNRS